MTILNESRDLLLQHLSMDGFTQQFISGAGSEVTSVTPDVPYSKFEASTYGFMYFSIDQTRLNVKTIDYTGKNIYETTLKKSWF